jgi:lipopolysaccharide transport system ATP-binding protein
MSEIAIRFQNVSKRFTVQRGRPRSFQELFLSWRQHRGRGRVREDLWVLKDFSIDVAESETLGIIGPNGVGKSTILKLIAGIILPNEGQVEVSGRVSSLLELGAGFHPDMTGRENIFLYGSLLGLSRATMRQRFDDIVAFSELESFIDVPVKTYSSGMYLRLAFAVAIHVEPDVLLVDEILAVGDQAFRAKCLERILALKRGGVTILLVTHDLSTVRQLCSRAIWMHDGRLRADGSSDRVAQQYLDAVARVQNAQLTARNLEAAGRERQASAPAVTSANGFRWGSGEIEITEVRVLDSAGQERYVFLTGEELTIQMTYSAAKPVQTPVFGLALHRSDGLHITGPNTQFSDVNLPIVEGEGAIHYTIPHLPLLPGRYQISVAARDAEDTRLFDYHDRLYSFAVNPGGTQERYGLMCMGGQWR